MWLYSAPVLVVMSQYFVEYIDTVTTPLDDGVEGVTTACTRTPYGVSFLNARSSAPQATVASRPLG